MYTRVIYLPNGDTVPVHTDIRDPYSIESTQAGRADAYFTS